MDYNAVAPMPVIVHHTLSKSPISACLTQQGLRVRGWSAPDTAARKIMCACMRACVRAYVRVCVCVGVYVCAYAAVSACECARARAWLSVTVYVFASVCVSACARWHACVIMCNRATASIILS